MCSDIMVQRIRVKESMRIVVCQSCSVSASDGLAYTRRLVASTNNPLAR